MIEIIIICILLLLSAFFSASEIAFVVSNKLKIEIKARQKNLAAMNATYFIKNTQDFFSTILIGNNVVNIAFGSIITIFLTEYFGLTEFSILLISTVILLFLGELIPKYLARETADKVVTLSAIPIRMIYYALFPLVKILSSLSNFLTRSENIKEESINMLFSREEIQMLFKESHFASNTENKENNVFNKIFELSDQRVYEAMRPRTDIVGIEIDSSMDEVYNAFIESGYSKVPVYEENIDNIKGIVIAYDLFKKPQNLKEITREVIFVPDTKRSIEMLKEFLEKRISFAVVIDEFGGTAGIITMEDILEELLGEIRDEFDTDDEICRKVTDEIFVIGGRVEIDYLNENYNLKIPEGDYSTIAGFITYNTGRIPPKGEVINIERFKIQVLRSTSKRVELVKLFINEDEE